MRIRVELSIAPISKDYMINKGYLDSASDRAKTYGHQLPEMPDGSQMPPQHRIVNIVRGHRTTDLELQNECKALVAAVAY